MKFFGTLLFGTLALFCPLAGAQTPETAPGDTPRPSVPETAVLEPVTAPKPLETIEVFGYSVENRPLTAHIFGDGPNRTLIFACVHGNEIATPEVARLLRLHLLKHPEIMAGRQVVLVPLMNPDGLQRRSRLNARGVDINRNYPGTWRLPRRGERFKPGTAPASEPESRAMMALVKKYPPQKIVSIHQPLHCLIYSGERSAALAREMQKFNRYRIAKTAGYPTPGGFGGYCEQILKVPVVTLELPWQSAAAAWKINATALLAAIRFQMP